MGSSLGEIVALLGTTGFWVATVRISAVYIFGAMGEVICERAGVLNLAIEGTMVSGAATGFLSHRAGASLWASVGLAVVTGMVCGAIVAFLEVYRGLDPYVVGIGLTLLFSGLSFYAYQVASEGRAVGMEIAGFEALPIPWLEHIPGVGPVLFASRPLVYVALILVPVLAWFLTRTPAGLSLRSVGENPLAVSAAGIDARHIRAIAVVAGSGLMSAGGAYMSLSYFGGFNIGIISGRGWICIALVIFGAWKPGRILLAIVFFSAIDALAVRVQALGIDLPFEIFMMLPYVVTLGAMVFASRNVSYPKALAIPLPRDGRS